MTPPDRQRRLCDVSIRLDTVPALDRQTDRSTERRQTWYKNYRALRTMHAHSR